MVTRIKEAAGEKLGQILNRSGNAPCSVQDVLIRRPVVLGTWKLGLV